jgi:hypothetical protein
MEAELLDEKSMEDILMELLTLRAFNVSGKWRLMEVSKKTENDIRKDGDRSSCRGQSSYYIIRAEFRFRYYWISRKLFYYKNL